MVHNMVMYVYNLLTLVTAVLVNFSATSYRANFNAISVIVRVMAFGSFASPFLVEVVPDTDDVPEGT